MQQFAAQLSKLQKMGLNATELSPIAQAWSAQGLQMAQGITAGGKAAITELNGIQKKMQAAGAQTEQYDVPLGVVRGYASESFA